MNYLNKIYKMEFVKFNEWHIFSIHNTNRILWLDNTFSMSNIMKEVDGLENIFLILTILRNQGLKFFC